MTNYCYCYRKSMSHFLEEKCHNLKLLIMSRCFKENKNMCETPPTPLAIYTPYWLTNRPTLRGWVRVCLCWALAKWKMMWLVVKVTDIKKIIALLVPQTGFTCEWHMVTEKGWQRNKTQQFSVEVTISWHVYGWYDSTAVHPSLIICISPTNQLPVFQNALLKTTTWSQSPAGCFVSALQRRLPLE